MENIERVPLKVKRHVYRAIADLAEKEKLSAKSVQNLVNYSMRNLVPVKNLREMVKASLNEMADDGVIVKHKFGYFSRIEVPNDDEPIDGHGTGYEVVYKNDKKGTDYGRLDPNRNVKNCSNESFSGDEFERLRKRLRTNTKRLKPRKRGLLPLRQPRKHHQAVQKLPLLVDVTEQPDFGEDMKGMEVLKFFETKVAESKLSHNLSCIKPTHRLSDYTIIPVIDQEKNEMVGRLLYVSVKNSKEELCPLHSKSQTLSNSSIKPELQEPLCYSAANIVKSYFERINSSVPLNPPDLDTDEMRPPSNQNSHVNVNEVPIPNKCLYDEIASQNSKQWNKLEKNRDNISIKLEESVTLLRKYTDCGHSTSQQFKKK